MGQRQAWVEFQRGLELGDRFALAAQRIQGQAAVVMGEGKIRLKTQRLLIVRQGVLVLSLDIQNIPQRIVSVGV